MIFIFLFAWLALREVGQVLGCRGINDGGGTVLMLLLAINPLCRLVSLRILGFDLG